MCRQALGFSNQNIAELIPILFEEWHIMQPDGFGYWIETLEDKEYMLKSPENRDFIKPDLVKSFLLHCRSATSGKEHYDSNHPFLSEDKTLLLTHNGILWGYDELRKKLLRTHQFKSAVDSEVLLHLFEDIFKDNNCEFSQKMIQNYVKALIVNGVSGSVNMIMVDRVTKNWFVVSGGSIEVCKFMNPEFKLDNETLLLASDVDAFDWIKDKTVFSYDLPMNYAMLGNRNQIKELFEVDKINVKYYYQRYGFKKNGWGW